MISLIMLKMSKFVPTFLEILPKILTNQKFWWCDCTPSPPAPTTLFTQDMRRYITEQTNLYANRGKNKPEWSVSEKEMVQLFGNSPLRMQCLSRREASLVKSRKSWSLHCI